MSAQETSDKAAAMNAREEPFNGAEVSGCVLGRDWNSPEEDAAWSNL
jgi:hypothetical protein